MTKPIGVTIQDDQLAQFLEQISRQTDTPLDRLISMGLWDFVRSFDWNYHELKEGVIYQPAVCVPDGLLLAAGLSPSL